jgi:hypothetical protein
MTIVVLVMMIMFMLVMMIMMIEIMIAMHLSRAYLWTVRASRVERASPEADLLGLAWEFIL